MRLQKHHIIIGFISVIVLYFVANGIYNYFLSEEQKIKRLFSQMASDIEEKDVLGFGGYFASDAQVHYRGIDIPANQIGFFLRGQLERRNNLKVSYKELAIELKENGKAIVTFIAEATNMVERTRGAIEGTVKLIKKDNEWKVQDVVGREHRTPRMQF